MNRKLGSPIYEQHIIEILERAKLAVRQAREGIAKSQKLCRESNELLDKINTPTIKGIAREMGC